MCSDTGSDHAHLLYHSAFRWVWRGNVLQRVTALHVEVETILSESNHPLTLRSSNYSWISKLAYLSDKSAKIRELNVWMQGRDQTRLADKLTASKGRCRIATCRRTWLKKGVCAVQLALASNVWLMTFQTLLAFSSSLSIFKTTTHCTIVFENSYWMCCVSG